MNISKLYIPFLFLFFLTASLLRGQTSELIKDIEFYADIVSNASRTEHRIRANEELVLAMDSFLSETNSFDVKLKAFSVLYGQDSSFRLITWQVNKGDSLFNQYGRIQHETGKWTALHDNPASDDVLYQSFDANNWIGAIYYDIKAFVYNNKTAYLICGYDAHSQYNRRKIADILFFDEAGDAHFGLPVFAKENQDAERYGQYRIVLTYSLENRVLMQYDLEKEMLVFDHLISFDGRYPNQGRTAVPDGSYEAYQLKKGAWRYVNKVYNQTQVEPPTDGKVREVSEKRNLLGKKK